MQPIRHVSIVVPMRNEVADVETLVADIAAQDFAGTIDVVVADGGSTDGSVERLVAAARRAAIALEVVPNPQLWVSQGLNACIRRARGELLVRLDCHSRYPPDYVRRCVEVAEESGAEAVGGIVVPEGQTAMERAVACAMDGPFGGIGWMRGTTKPVRRESDILTYGSFRPSAFERAGLFDEGLRRNQDDEFTLRLRRAGGRVVLDSAIRVFYRPRGSLSGVFRQYYQYGYWKAAVIRKHTRIPSARSAAPPLFVVSLVGFAAAAPFAPPALLALVVEATTYAAFAVVFGASSIRRRREPWQLLPRVVAVFPAFHFGYGVGLLRGLTRRRWALRDARGPAPAVEPQTADVAAPQLKAAP